MVSTTAVGLKLIFPSRGEISTSMVRAQKRSAPIDLDDTERPQKSAPSGRIGARSCEGCHQRKVRCDRDVPCTNCSRYGMTCVYPTRDPDTERKTPSLRDIANRLKGIELLLSRLGDKSEISTGDAADGDAGHRQALATPSVALKSQSSASANTFGATNPYPSDRAPNKSTWEILLNHSDGEPLQDESSGSETAPSHPHGNASAKEHFPTHSDPSIAVGNDFDMAFYPDTQLALRLWDVYVKSVDPVIKILHIPTVQSAVVATILDPRSAQPSTLALTFAIYYAAVTALFHEGHVEPVDLPCEKPLLLERYQTALDRLLVTPDFMGQPEIASLQAFAIYVTCIRARELGRRVWVLTGLVIRLAQSISLHRDGSSLKLSPFETEMRIRLWWHLCVLDSRAPEDQGLQPSIDLVNQELRLPLNVNDDQLYPTMKNFPTASKDWTEMTFFLIQTESCRIMHPVLDIQQQQYEDTTAGLREKRRMIEDPAQYLMENFGLSPSSGARTNLSRITIQHVITGCKKMEFVLQLREEICLRKQQTQNDTTPEVLKHSFKLACDALDCSRVLLQDCSTSKFKWFFNMYTQWYALAYVLRCLRSSPAGLGADRAWALIDGLFPHERDHQDGSMAIHDEHGHGRIWKFLKVLRHRAWSLRQDANIPSASAHDQAQLQLPSNAEASQPTSFPGEDNGLYAIPEWGDEFLTGPDQILSPALDLLMPEIPFLPDWNAIINGQ